MDCPAGTVMSRLYRGRKMLQKLLYSYALEQGIVKAGRPLTTPADDERGHAGDAPLDLDSYRRRTGRGGQVVMGRVCSHEVRGGRRVHACLRGRRAGGGGSGHVRAAPAGMRPLFALRAGCRPASRRRCAGTCRPGGARRAEAADRGRPSLPRRRRPAAGAGSFIRSWCRRCWRPATLAVIVMTTRGQPSVAVQQAMRTFSAAHAHGRRRFQLRHGGRVVPGQGRLPGAPPGPNRSGRAARGAAGHGAGPPGGLPDLPGAVRATSWR